MCVSEEFDAWADDGRDRGMENRHWATAKHALARMPVEADDIVIDLGTGSGYALRALRERGVARGYGIDGSPQMVENALQYTDDACIEYVVGDFESLPFGTDSISHAFSMEAFYYARDPHATLEEAARVLEPGGTFYCAVDFFEENTHTHHWQDTVDVEMTLWDRSSYRDAFRSAGFHVAEQDTIPNRAVDIPEKSAFPTDGFETREAMVERYRTYGTLLTVGVVS
ncbi:MAG: class I SAM-dependent methyltransferase [Halodesulfurarchaeum sp.]